MATNLYQASWKWPKETPEIVRILPCDDDDRQLDYAGMRVEALARAEARMAFGLFTAADLKYLRKNLKKRPWALWDGLADQ